MYLNQSRKQEKYVKYYNTFQQIATKNDTGQNDKNAIWRHRDS